MFICMSHGSSQAESVTGGGDSNGDANSTEEVKGDGGCLTYGQRGGGKNAQEFVQFLSPDIC